MKKVYRGILILAVIVGIVILLNNYSNEASKCSGKLTPALTEGPYYKSGSPQRTNIRKDAVGEDLVLTGYVYDKTCRPISGAWLDFWQAGGNGVYDNAGYKLRGHQFTDKDGKYVLETVIPAKYSGRTPHIHVKVMADDKSPILTTQLFFPGESQNERDSIFNKDLIVKMLDQDDIKQAFSDFILNSK